MTRAARHLLVRIWFILEFIKTLTAGVDFGTKNGSRTTLLTPRLFHTPHLHPSAISKITNSLAGQ